MPVCKDGVMRKILIQHSLRYPEWEIDDIYKLIHQAAMGSEHAIENIAAARDWLRRELDQLSPGGHEPLLDPISPDGRIVRVHLRPFVASQFQEEVLLQAFIQTVRVFPPSPEQFAAYAAATVQLAEEGILRFPPREVNAFFVKMTRQGLTAVRHSDRYRELYHPVYRVVAVELLPAEIQAAAGQRSQFDREYDRADE